MSKMKINLIDYLMQEIEKAEKKKREEFLKRTGIRKELPEDLKTDFPKEKKN